MGENHLDLLWEDPMPRSLRTAGAGALLIAVVVAACSNELPTPTATATADPAPSATALVSRAPIPVAGAAGIRFIGNRIVDAKGNRLVLRGPELVVAGEAQTQDIDQIAALGANALRMLLTLDAANGMTPEGFDALLAAAVSHHMLVWVSLYTWDDSRMNVIADALGGGYFYGLEAPAGTSCSRSTPVPCYLAVWTRPWLKDLIRKYRDNVIVDAMQEFISPGDPGTEEGRATWAEAAKTNVQFFRAQGYDNPLEIMANFQGRDLYGIVEYGQAIREADTVRIEDYPQTMFGWQAYWGTDDGFYPRFQGSLLLGQGDGVVTGPEAIHEFAATRAFPIQIGIDNVGGDTNRDYKAEIDQAAADGMSWLWWSWSDGTVECPVSGKVCQAYVTTSENGFKGASALAD
jgi:hypothetical protein